MMMMTMSGWNRIPYELKCKREIECYDKINEIHPKYPVIILSCSKIQTKTKEDCINIKVKSVRNINYKRMIYA